MLAAFLIEIVYFVLKLVTHYSSVTIVECSNSIYMFYDDNEV